MSIINDFREGSSLAKRPAPRRLNVDTSGIRRQPVDLNQQAAPVQLASPIEPEGRRDEVTRELDAQALANIEQVNSREVQQLTAPVLFSGPPPTDELWERYKQTYLQPRQSSKYDDFEELMPFASRRDPLRSPFEDNQVAGAVADNDPNRILGDEFNPIEGRWGQMGEGGFGGLMYGVNLLGAVGAELMGVVADSALDFVDDWRGFFSRGGVRGADRLINRARRGLNGSIVWQALLGRDASVSGLGQMLSGTDVADGYERIFGPNILDQQASEILSGAARVQWGLSQDEYLAEVGLFAENEQTFRAARMEAGAEVFGELGGFSGLLRPLNILADRPQVEEQVQRRAYDKLRANGTLGEDFSFQRYQRLNTLTTRERTVRLLGDFAMPDPADLGKVLTRGSLYLTRGIPSVNRVLRTNLATGQVMDVVLANGGRQLFDDVIFVNPRTRQAAQTAARALPTARITPGQDSITPSSSVQVYEPRTPIPQNGVLITPPPNSDSPVQLAIEGTSQRLALPPAPEAVNLPALDLDLLFGDVSVEDLADQIADTALTPDDVAPGVSLLGASELGTEARDFVLAAAEDASSAPEVNRLITDTVDGNTVGAMSYHREIPGVAYVRNFGSTRSGGGRKMMEELFVEVLSDPDLNTVRLNSMADARGFYERMGMRSVSDDGISPTYEIDSQGIRDYFNSRSEPVPEFRGTKVEDLGFRTDVPDTSRQLASSTPLELGESVNTPNGLGSIIDLNEEIVTVSLDTPDANDFRRWSEEVYKPVVSNPPATAAELGRIPEEDLFELARNIGVEPTTRRATIDKLKGKVGRNQVPVTYRGRSRFNPSQVFDDFNERVAQARRLGAQGDNDTVVLLDAVRRADSPDGFTGTFQRSQVSRSSERLPELSQLTLGDGSVLQPLSVSQPGPGDISIPATVAAPGALPDALRRRSLGQESFLPSSVGSGALQGDMLRKLDAASLIPGADGTPSVPPTQRYVTEYQRRTGRVHPFAELAVDTAEQALGSRLDTDDLNFISRWADENLEPFGAEELSKFETQNSVRVDVGGATVELPLPKGVEGPPLPEFSTVDDEVFAHRVQSVQYGKERAEYQRLTDTPGVYDSDEALEYISEAEAAFNDVAAELDAEADRLVDELTELYDDELVGDDSLLEELYDDQAFNSWVETNNTGRFC